MAGSRRAELALSPDDVRRIFLRAQGFLGAAGRAGGVGGMLHRIGAVQLDTISVLARSHELVAYARLGAIGRKRVEQAYWHPRRPATFEYWAHAACILPIEEWPYYAFRRRAFRARGLRWHEVPERACKEVLSRLHAEGPLTASDLGGAKAGGPWWDWSEVKIAVEWLLDIGEVACVRRNGWRRVYDLPSRAIPAPLLASDPSDAECLARLTAVAGRALGVATTADLIEYHRLRSVAGPTDGLAERVERAAEAAGLVPVSVGAEPARPAARRSGAAPRSRALQAWADPAALAAAPRGRHRTALLSPFDSLIWDRKRTERVFGFRHSLEAYVPAAKRVHGYYVMPLLASGRLSGRVDPVRRGRTLVARRVSLPGAAAVAPMAAALRDAAAWVGCDEVQLGVVNPPEFAKRLSAALR